MELVAFRRAAEHISDVLIDPVIGGVLVARGVAQRHLAVAGAAAIEREALARRALIHEECRRSVRAGQQPAADEFQSHALELGRAQRRAEPLRQPFDEVRALIAGHFDRMADFDHVEPIGFERVGGEAIEVGRRGGLGAAREPAGGAAGDEGNERGGNGRRHPAAAAARQPLDLEPLWRHFVGNPAVALANDLGLGAPGGDAGCVIGVGGKPGFDRAAAVGGQLAVDIGVQFVFADHLISVSHRLLSYFTRRSAGRSPSR